jgi:hypothetical protein
MTAIGAMLAPPGDLAQILRCGKQIPEWFRTTDYMERVDVHALQPYWSLHRESRVSAPGKPKRSR